MNKKSILFTKTIAALYMAQGYNEEAEEIYSYLNINIPDEKNDMDIQKEISIDKKNDIVTLFDQWTQLLVPKNRIEKIRTIVNKL